MVPGKDKRGSSDERRTSAAVDTGPDLNKTNVDAWAGLVPPPSVVRPLLAADGLLGTDTSTKRRYMIYKLEFNLLDIQKKKKKKNF